MCYDDKIKKSKARFDVLLSRHEFELLSDYKRSSDYVIVKCNNGHIRKIKPYTYLQKNRCTCRNCASSGSQNGFWGGGTSPLNLLLRKYIKTTKWFFDSMKYYNYKCIITDENNNQLHLHHPYSFNKMLSEVLVELGISEPDKYDDNKLFLIKNKLENKHYHNGYGTPMIPSVHKLFHNIYGHDNNYNQLEEFITTHGKVSVSLKKEV